MGVLDDAIREHLELRRKHGAPDEELRRQEMEALGPARRDAGTPEEHQLEPDVVRHGAEETDPERKPHAEEAAAVEPEPYFDEAPLEEGSPYHEVHDPAEPRLGDSSEHGYTSPHGHAAAEDEELDQDQEDEAESDDRGDVLEDTPEFLQETPEHDRLWFEQKPPRDFDFD
jgi:hypothetical protein